MKQLLFVLALAITPLFAGEQNNPDNPGYNVAAQVTGLITACMHKEVFKLLTTMYQNNTDLAAALEALEKKTGVALVKHKDTSAFSAPLQSELCLKTYESTVDAANLSEAEKAELQRIHIMFGVVFTLIKTRVEDSVFNEQETEAALVVLEQIKKELRHTETLVVQL